jgi:predicted permease
VFRLLAIEGLVLGVVSAAAGVLASRGALRAMAPLVERVLQRRVPGGLDAFVLGWPALMLVGAVALAVTLAFTLAPLLVNRRPQLVSTLGAMSRGSTEPAASGRTRAVLIAIEIAASLTLVTGAALMVQTAAKMLNVDFGVQADTVGTASLSLRERSYPDAATRLRFYERLLSSLRGAGAASRAALGDWWPLQGSRPRRIEASGSPPVVSQASVFAVTDDYFDTLGISRRDGRSFAPEDRQGSEPVAIVSESVARQLWPAERAVDQRLTIQSDEERPPVAHRVIGVVSDVRQMHTDTDLKDVYLPFSQRASRFAFMYLRAPRAENWQSQLRMAVAAIDREVAVGAPRWLSAGFDDERTRPEFVASLLAVFAGFASVLALVGMHGVIAYAVGQREREIAIRMAVGADPRAITTLFLRQGGLVLAAGLAAGLAGATALGNVLRSQLFGIAPDDPTVLAGATAAFVLCALAAMWWPAARAAALDPARVLNRE